MATFAELQTRVQQIIIDLPTAVTSQVPTLVRESIRRLQRLHDFKVAEALSSVYTTVAGTRVLAAVPSDFYKMRKLPHLIDVGGITRDLGVFPDRGSAEREYGTLAGGEADTDALSGPPRFIMLSEGDANFEVYPLPDATSTYANGNYRIRVQYWKFLTALSAGSDTNWFTENAEQWIVWDAASKGFLLDWDEERASVWATMAQGAYKEVIDQDKRKRMGGFDTLQASSDALAPRMIGGDNTGRQAWPFRQTLLP